MSSNFFNTLYVVISKMFWIAPYYWQRCYNYRVTLVRLVFRLFLKQYCTSQTTYRVWWNQISLYWMPNLDFRGVCTWAIVCLLPIKLDTVMRIIKLNLFPVPVRLHSGPGKLILRHYFTTFFLYLRILWIVWSLLIRRDTRRLTSLQTMRNVLKYSKIV